MTTPFNLNGKILTRKNSYTWICQVSRFLWDYKNNNFEELIFNLTSQYFILHNNILYMYKNYNFNDENFYCNFGSDQDGLYKIEISDNKKFNLILTKIWKYQKPKKGNKHPNNLFDLDDKYTLDEKTYDDIMRKINSNQVIDVEIDNKPLELLIEKFNEKPFFDEDSKNVNLWWVKGKYLPNKGYHRYFIKFLDAKLLRTKDKELPCLSIDNIIYQQHHNPGIYNRPKNEFYFKK